ncbi:hypothetical protein ABPG75_009016 [Micractinium tetrahymenae]
MRAAWVLLLAACCTLDHICQGQQDPDAAAPSPSSGAPSTGGSGATLPPAPDLPLDRITLPPGFSISLYVDATFPARFFALGKTDANATVVFVSSTKGTVTAIVDTGAASPRACTLLRGLDVPNGIAYDRATGALFISEVTRITRYAGADAAALAGCDASLLSSALVSDQLPQQEDHDARALAIGPRDGKLYVTVAAPFNLGTCVEPFCTIHRLDKNGSNFEVFASGIRNAAGFEWHPDTGDLLFAGMERDNMPPDHNNAPDDVLVAVQQAGTGYGWPYCHWVGKGPPEQRQPGPGSIIPDPEITPPQYGQSRPPDATLAQRCSEQTPPPVQALGPHVAPLGVLFWAAAPSVQSSAGSSNGSSGGGGGGAAPLQRWPAQYDGTVFVGEHGSWNRDPPIGYRISNVALSADGRTAVGHTVFAQGWLGSKGSAWGRPVGLLRLPDSSMLVADDKNGVVYRISYGEKTGSGSSGASRAAPAAAWMLALVLGMALAALLCF